jgi:dihydrofolate reductase
MRNIYGSVFVSLDGVIQAPGGPSEDPTGRFEHGGWLPQFFDEDVGEAIDAFFGSSYDLLLGRRTYEIFAAYWPYLGGDTTGIGEVFEATGSDDGEASALAMAAAFTTANKYVLTRGAPDLGWANSHKLDDLEALRALKQSEGPPLLIQGSGMLYPQLLSEGLLDRLTLMTFPVVIGSGKRLFGDGTPPLAMTLADQKVTRGGAVIATYQPGGSIEQGWAGPQSTNVREVERQQQMADGNW